MVKGHRHGELEIPQILLPLFFFTSPGSMSQLAASFLSLSEWRQQSRDRYLQPLNSNCSEDMAPLTPELARQRFVHSCTMTLTFGNY